MPTIQSTEILKRNSNPLALEQQAFERQRSQLLRRFPGQFVAIYGGRGVGHDKDDETLAAPMYSQVGESPFFFAPVEKKPPIYQNPSPQAGRAARPVHT